MSKPREIRAGRFYMVTRRCTQRMFLLWPDRHCRATFLYCLALAAERTGVVVMLPVVMGNHHHTICYDPEGRIAEFTHYLHHLVARAMNAARGRWENFWASEQVCVVRLDDREAVLRAMVYAATNPIKDHLVARVHQWPGVHGLGDLLRGRALHVARPAGFFQREGPMPAAATLRLEVPEVSGMGDCAQFLDELRARVAAREAEIAAARGGRRVLGVRAVRRQSPASAPTSWTPRRGLRPMVAASGWARVEALQRDAVFVARYRAARLAWRAGLAAEFPPGTYWLRRFAHITIAEL